MSEAGPGDQRPNPHLITKALGNLRERGLLEEKRESRDEEGRFHALKASLGVTATDEAWMRRRGIYLVYRTLARHQEYCGDVLERIVDSALERSGVVSGFEGRFPGCRLPETRPLDFVVNIGGVRWGGEVKNLRKWLYPDCWEIWLAISKCCEADVVPMMVARKFHHVSFSFFKEIGALGYQTHFQFFHPAVAEQMQGVRAVDGLGFKDIRFGNETDQNLIRFFAKTVTRMAPSCREKFERSKDILREFADVRGLAAQNLGKRSEIWKEAWRAIRGEGSAEETGF